MRVETLLEPYSDWFSPSDSKWNASFRLMGDSSNSHIQCLYSPPPGWKPDSEHKILVPSERVLAAGLLRAAVMSGRLPNSVAIRQLAHFLEKQENLLPVPQRIHLDPELRQMFREIIADYHWMITARNHHFGGTGNDADRQDHSVGL